MTVRSLALVPPAGCAWRNGVIGPSSRLGGVPDSRTLTRPTQSWPALAVVQYNALPHQRSCRVRGGSLPLPRFGFAASRLSALSRLPHSRCSQDDSLHRSRRVFAPTFRPKAVSFLSIPATRTRSYGLPQERTGLNCAHVPRTPSLWRFQARFRHAFP